MKKLIADNLVYGLVCVFTSSLVAIATIVGVPCCDSIFARITLPLCFALPALFIHAFLLNLVILTCVEVWGAYTVGGWCRYKAFAYFLMFNVFNLSSSENRSRKWKLLQRIKLEFEDPDV